MTSKKGKMDWNMKGHSQDNVTSEPDVKRKITRPPMLTLSRCESVSFRAPKKSTAIEEETSRGTMWSVAARRGRRRTNREDMYSVLPFVDESLNNEPISLFAIFDGHGGQRVAQYASTRLPRLFLEAYEKSGELQIALHDAFLATDEEVIAESVTPCSRERPFHGVHLNHTSSGSSLGLVNLQGLSGRSSSSLSGTSSRRIRDNRARRRDRTVGKYGKGSVSDDALEDKRSEKFSTHSLSESLSKADEKLSPVPHNINKGCGTTATVVVLVGLTCCIAHVGDSRAVLSANGGVVKRLFEDHRPSRQDEMERIESAGGIVVQSSGAHRVNGVLAVSRAIGDVGMKKFVISQPETTAFCLCGTEEFIIIASDGLWDFVSDTESVALIRGMLVADSKDEGYEEAASKLLVQTAWERGSNDDVSVIVVNLMKYCKLCDKNGDVFGDEDIAANALPELRTGNTSTGGTNGIKLEMVTPVSDPAETPQANRDFLW